ncbi:MAG TPA: hypothetical protein VEX60_04180, partial [Pyrinomonadaceae bacterium]|nr:hypothetical protein [Pyrinomonadaceae bacterium]
MTIKTNRYTLNEQEATYFADQFKMARAAALLDGEDFKEILFALERFGSFLIHKADPLSQLMSAINEVACESPLAKEIPKKHKSWHIPFSDLYEMVMTARNDALHQGAVARHLTTHAIELSIILEDALMGEMKKVSYLMVRNPVCAYFWQPISFVRQAMLVNSFSYLPLQVEGGRWTLISDRKVAQYLRVNSDMRKERMAKTISQAHSDGDLKFEKASWCSSEDGTDKALIKMSHRPLLVHLPEQRKHLIGILSPFDLL